MPERITADEIADRLERPRPTGEQRAVIEAPLEPALVVAGAGSGKTETMASRVLWLVANGLVQPRHVLGLTFTRKAANELAERIRDRVATLARVGLAPRYDAFDPPVVSTYNAFANAVYRDHAARIGREGSGPVLGEASAWQLARRVVVDSLDPALVEIDRSVDAVVQLVLDLAGNMAEHRADPAAVRDFAARYGAAIAALPHGATKYQSEVDEAMRPAVLLPVLTRLVETLDERKRALSAVQYADQVPLAIDILAADPSLAAEYRDRHRVVLLDEYQDTSVVQTQLLARLFGGTPVMAVGDPHQSIYGWRGASSANLERFGDDFGSGRTFPLSVSWRNGTRILDAANTIAAPLTAASRVPVERLAPSPSASGEPVEVVYAETLHDEAGVLADWFAAQLDGDGEKPTAAMLVRTRSTLPVLLGAFRERGVKTHVLGVGGLLQQPEVADLVCALRVVHDPSAGVELVRLLAGGTWRVGPADLAALQRLARFLETRDHAGQRLEDPVVAVFRGSVAEGESASVVDALDVLAQGRELRVDFGFSPDGLVRLRDAGRRFRDLRRRASGDLVDFVRLVVETLDLDVEVQANENRSLAPLQAFDEALAGYLAVGDATGLGGFLGWLDAAERREDLMPRSDPPEPGTVQVLTIHGSKGLEWDVVAVPRLVEAELPAKPRTTAGWLAPGVLPYRFRGDAAELPEFAWRGLADRVALKQELRRFKQAVGEHLGAEERRLAYVAVTRARHRLLLTGSWWAGQVKPRDPSEFLRDLADAGVVPPLPAAPASAARPPDGEPATFLWPGDPLGTRRAAVEHSAALVRAADPDAAGEWRDDVDLLLAERAVRGRGPVAVPDRIPASGFKDWIDDPAAVLARIGRPMPERPYRATRLGTRFHAWVEQRAGMAGGEELVDASDAERDLWADEADGDDEAFEALQRRFEASPWGDLEPLEVETEIQLPFEGHVVVCKLDAVYRRGSRIEIVDWKTGAPPKSAADLELKQLQLALYRLAYAKREGIDPAGVDALLYYVAVDQVIRPASISSEAELRARWSAAVAASTAPS